MIALDTGHLVYNYGTKLQAYAMQTLLEANGENVEIIQWHKRNLGVLNHLSDTARLIKKVHSRYGFKLIYAAKAICRYRAIDSFNKKYHLHKFYGDFASIKEQTKIYSSAFCGSDQAWLPGNVSHHAYTLEYFSDNTFKAAYAPSFGIDSIDDHLTKQYETFLSKIDSLSVREISGQTIIKGIIHKNVPVVLDPTLLLEKTDWEELRKEATVKIPCHKKYIFCYFLGENAEHRKAVKQYAIQNGYKIINLQHFFKYCKADEGFGDYNLYKITPQDFIELIAKADMVCTDSFHCTAFSIQYHKQFTVFHRFSRNDKASTNNRLYSLLGQIALEQRISQEGSGINNDPINYAEVDEKLYELRRSSREYLVKAMRGIPNV